MKRLPYILLLFLLVLASCRGKGTSTNTLPLPCNIQKHDTVIGAWEVVYDAKKNIEVVKPKRLPLDGTNLNSNPDSTINGIFMLSLYEHGYSVESFVGMPHDSIPLIEDKLPLCKREGLCVDCRDIYSMFVNVDRTELLIATQTPGGFRNEYSTFIVTPITPENKYVLDDSRCIYTSYAHFRTENGICLGMTQEELIALKGEKYSIREDGDMVYQYLPEDLPEVTDVEDWNWYVEHETGIHWQEFSFVNGIVTYFMIAFSI